MTTVDYSNYLEQQNQWVTSLVRVARSSEPEAARELAEIIVQSLHRMLDMTWSQSPKFHLPTRQPEPDAPELPCCIREADPVAVSR